MDYKRLPQIALARLLALDEEAEALAKRVEEIDLGISRGRQGMRDAPSQKVHDEVQTALQRLIADRPLVEGRANATQSVLSSAKFWLDTLPPDVMLEAVAAETNGYDNVRAVRERIADLDRQRRTIETVVPLDVLREDVTKHVEELAAKGTPRVIRNDGDVAFVREGRSSRIDTTEPSSWWAYQCWRDTERIIRALRESLDQQASDLQRVPAAKRSQRVAEIERELEELARVEEVLIERAISAGEAVERRSDAPPDAVLMVKVVEKATRAA